MNAAILSSIEKSIKGYGHHMFGIFPDAGKEQPSFTYTIGLSADLGFELICIGLPMQFAGTILNQIAAACKAGEKLELGVNDDRWANLPTRFYECDNKKAREWAVQAYEYYGTRRMKFYQMVMPDKNSVFPGEPGFDEAYMNHRQPLLYTPCPSGKTS